MDLQEIGVEQKTLAHPIGENPTKRSASNLTVSGLWPDSGQTYHFLLDSSLMGVYITLNGIIARCNDRFANMFECAKLELIGKNLDDVLRSKQNSETRYCMLTLQHIKSDEGIRIINTRTKNGNPIWLKCVVHTVENDKDQVTLGNVIDITEQVKVEDSLLESEKELRSLSMQLINAQENERKRVASELHDGICQTLSWIKYKVEQGANVCGSDLCEVEKLKQLVVVKIQNAIEEVRRISMDLRPSILDDLGILETIEWQLREFRAMHEHIEVNKQIDIEELQIPEHLKISMFRILQEALNNISKHAEATAIKVQLSVRGMRLHLNIEDNGKGIAPSILKPQSYHGERIGLGLKNMQERTKLAGGVFEIRSVLSGGTSLVAHWPLV